MGATNLNQWTCISCKLNKILPLVVFYSLSTLIYLLHFFFILSAVSNNYKLGNGSCIIKKKKYVKPMLLTR